MPKRDGGGKNCFRRDVIAVMARGSELGNACTYMRTFPWSLENDWPLKERLGWHESDDQLWTKGARKKVHAWAHNVIIVEMLIFNGQCMFSKLNGHSDKWPNNANTWVDLCCSCFRAIAWLQWELPKVMLRYLPKSYFWKIFDVTYLDPWKLSWVTWDPSRLNAAQRTHGLHATLRYSLHFWKALLGKEIGRTGEPDRDRRNEKI